MKLAALLQRLTPFDRKLLLILVVLVSLSFLLLQQGAGARVLVESGDNTIFVADLDQDQQVELRGPLGLTLLKISAGSAQVVSSPCPQKICIGLGKAQHSGDLLACVPNRLVIRIEGAGGDKERGYDFLSR